MCRSQAFVRPICATVWLWSAHSWKSSARLPQANASPKWTWPTSCSATVLKAISTSILALKASAVSVPTARLSTTPPTKPATPSSPKATSCWSTQAPTTSTEPLTSPAPSPSENPRPTCVTISPSWWKAT